jgi:hypothetical protein
VINIAVCSDQKENIDIARGKRSNVTREQHGDMAVLFSDNINISGRQHMDIRGPQDVDVTGRQCFDVSGR